MVSGVDDQFLRSILEPLALRHADILGAPELHRLQILLAVPQHDDDGTWRLVEHAYRSDAEYFYPASTVKTAAAIAALELLAKAREDGQAVDLDTPLRIHAQFEETGARETDDSNIDGGDITVGHEIRKLFLVSDNEAFNRLFELVGRDAVNESMHRVGLDSFHVVHRLAEQRTTNENRRFPRFDLLGASGQVVHVIEARVQELAGANLRPGEVARDLKVGQAHFEGGVRVEGPLDFSTKNRVDLADLQRLNVHLFRPELLPLETPSSRLPSAGRPRLRLSALQRAHLQRAMGELPPDSHNPEYDPAEIPFAFVKFVLPGLRRLERPDRFTVYNKVGRAYGFSIENAYVVDETSLVDGVAERSFFLNAVLYTNANDTLNDDEYEYAKADAFFADLGESVARLLWNDPSRSGD